MYFGELDSASSVVRSFEGVLALEARLFDDLVFACVSVCGLGDGDGGGREGEDRGGGGFALGCWWCTGLEPRNELSLDAVEGGE